MAKKSPPPLNVAQERHVHGIDQEDLENMNLLGVLDSGMDED